MPLSLKLKENVLQFKRNIFFQNKRRHILIIQCLLAVTNPGNPICAELLIQMTMSLICEAAPSG